MTTVDVETDRYWIGSRSVEESTNGDFVEFFALDAGRVAVVVGDAAGHGPIAGEAACALATYARGVLATTVPLRTALARIDRFFCDVVRCDVVPLATITVAVIDTKDRVIEYASAGHEPALLFQGLQQHVHLPPTGPVLGLNGIASPTFTQGRAHFSDRSYLVIVTDGITEARRYDGRRPRFFGSSGVVRTFVAARRAGADPARAILDEAERHAGCVVRDDATALVVALGRC